MIRTRGRITAAKEAGFAASRARVFESESLADTWDRSDAQCLQQLLDLDIPGVFSHPDLEELITKAAFLRGPKVLQLLFDRATAANCPVQRVSVSMVKAAASNSIYGHLLLPFLDEKTGDESPPSQDEVLLSAVAHGSVRSLIFLLGKSPQISYSEEFRIAAATNPDYLVTEFSYRSASPGSIGFAEREAAATNSDDALGCLFNRLSNTRPTTTSMTLGQMIVKH